MIPAMSKHSASTKKLVMKANASDSYNGKSTGAGSLGLWTHNLKSIEILDYESGQYSGKAMKMGAGIQGFEAATAAHDNQLTIVGGECPSVGLAGGYTQGTYPLSLPNKNRI